MKINKISLIVIAAFALVACKSNKSAAVEEEVAVQLVGPEFRADSAMVFCQKQCDFGPRVMNSEAHDACGRWIVEKFRSYGLDVQEQKTDVTGWDGTVLHSNNIIAKYNPEAAVRYLICAHWDCRPWADNDPDSTNWKKPVLAANDAASGVAVMLEIARVLKSDTTLNIGIDFVCFDAEDYGTPQWAEESLQHEADTWALGAQYFAKQYAAQSQESPVSYTYGILLDMVGGQGSKFYQEGFSMHFAADVVRKVWAASEAAGYGSFFVSEPGGTITDDHKPLNDVGIPTIDIIPYFPDCEQSAFGPTWHTVNDDMQHIDPNVLKAVGQTVIQTLWVENGE